MTRFVPTWLKHEPVRGIGPSVVLATLLLLPSISLAEEAGADDALASTRELGHVSDFRTAAGLRQPDRSPATVISNAELRRAAAGVGDGPAPPASLLMNGSRVVVSIRHSLSSSAVRALVEQVGGAVYRHIDSGIAEIYLPPGQIALLAASPGVLDLAPPPQIIPHQQVEPTSAVTLAGTVVGQEVAKTRANLWHAAGYDGSGVKVGIIDEFSSSVWNAAQSAGEVGVPSGTICRWGGASCNIWSVRPGAQHGTAVAEVVAEMAPGAQIYLATAHTPGDFLTVIDYFVAQGVTVVSHSATWSYDGPGDGTGLAASVVNYAASKGMLWINSAGNEAGGAYWRGAWTDATGNGWMDFAPGDEILSFYCGGGLGMRWSDWGVDPTDYDVYVWDTPGDVGTQNFKATSENDQTAGARPLENYSSDLLAAGCAGGGDIDYLAIGLYDAGGGTAGDILELGIHTLAEYWQNPYSAAIPFADSANPNVLSVGAIDPPTGAGAASYSSWGPTNDSRTKPDLTAAAGVSNFTYGRFHGTSASAPTVAGAVALVIDAGLATSPPQIISYLRSQGTVDRGTAGPDNTFGFGEVILPVPAPVPLPEIEPAAVGHTIGLVDPSQGQWHLYSHNGSLRTSFYFGNPGDYPIYGDWNCDGVETPGMYRQNDGYVYLRNANTQGVADVRFFFGNPGDLPIAGDFNGNGCDTVSIWRPSEGRVYIINALGSNDGGLGAAETSYLFGNPGDKPFVGDFNADGIETVGLHRETTGLVYFRNSHTQGVADHQFIFGNPGDRLIAGDWNDAGVYTPGLFRPSNTTVYLRFTNSQGNADHQWIGGSTPWIPVAGFNGL